MFKGKYGISLPAIAVLAFVLAFLGYWEMTLLLIGYAVVLEKDEWLGRQTMSALILSLLIYCIEFVVRRIFTAWEYCAIKIASWSDKFYMYNAKTENTILWIIGILFFVLFIISLIQVARHKDAKIPVVYGLTNWAFGFVVQKSYQQPVMYQQPVQQPAYQPVPQPVVPQQTTSTCPKCGATVNGKFCGICGTNIK
ncbi:MAG: hypothetical protein K0R15_2195 [Clostridiales bacterium]|jgi:hypothetical protein|nr:hypothetical protein [Clostridiales bacterium]